MYNGRYLHGVREQLWNVAGADVMNPCQSCRYTKRCVSGEKNSAASRCPAAFLDPTQNFGEGSDPRFPGTQGSDDRGAKKNMDIMSGFRRRQLLKTITQVNTVTHQPHDFDFRGHNVRAVIVDGNEWFVASDVCRALEIRNTSLAVNGNPSRDDNGGLDDDEKATLTIQTPTRGPQRMLCVSEPGLYALIFKSRTREAEAFKDWVCDEVLPTIRKTGGYVLNHERFLDTYLPFADDATRSMFRAALTGQAQSADRIAQAQAFIASQQRPVMQERRHVSAARDVVVDADYRIKDEE